MPRKSLPKSQHKPLNIRSRADVNRGLCPSQKRSYGSERDAENAAHDIYRKLGDINGWYRCPDCHGHFHLTSTGLTEAFITKFQQTYQKKKKAPIGPVAFKAKKKKKKGWPEQPKREAIQ